jgi:outer membrane protein
MRRSGRGTLAVLAAVLVVLMLVPGAAYAADGKVGYVDLRRAFYEYEKTKSMETSLTAFTEERQSERTAKVQELTKMRDAAEMLKGDAKEKRQQAIDGKLMELQEYDRSTRQDILNKRNDMFREVIEDIQKVVEEIGKAQGYSYILDSRNIMYAEKTLDLTDEALKALNK